MGEKQLNIKELIDLDELKVLFEAFSAATGFTTGLVDARTSEVLLGTGWRDVCIKFHRACEASAVHCKNSNIELTSDLNTLGDIRISHCENGLVDGSTPIIVKGQHLANLFTGQILFHEADSDFFKSLATKYDYDEEAYMDALAVVPVVNEEKFRSMLSFLSKIAIVLAEMGVTRLETEAANGEIIHQKNLLQSMIDSIPDLIFYKDTEENYLGCNKAFEKYTNLPQDELIGKSDLDLFPSSTAHSYRHHDQEMLKQGKARVNEERIIYPDGHEALLHTLKTPYIGPEGEPMGVIGVSRDISEQREMEEKFRIIFESASDGIILFDSSQRKIITANPSFLTMLGYSKQDLSSITIDKLISPTVDEITTKAIRQKMNLMQAINSELILQKKDGSDVEVEITSSPYESQDRQYMIAIVRDISERKKQEQETLRMEKLESVGVLAGGIAHDFNNILTAILGNLSLSESYVKKETPLHDLLDEAIKASIRAKDLTQQLLTFSKGGDPVKRYASITEVIKDSSEFVLHGSNVHCEYDIASNLAMAHIDTGQISQVIQNLVINARHAMPDGGVIKISAKNSDDEANNPKIIIEVADEGCGISAENLESIFDPYFSTKQEGSGLGLAISHSIISKHKGLLSATSTLGKGSCFRISLPAAKAQLSPEESPASTIRKTNHQPHKDSLRILLMDDDQMVRNIAGKILQQIGHQVCSTIDGESTLQEYAAKLDTPEKYDIVITDLTIPGGIGGYETAQGILKLNPQAYIIVSSGYSNDPIVAHYEDYGFSASIAKPFQFSEIQNVLQEYLNLS
jgi:PAS domain S-box-containing protein